MSSLAEALPKEIQRVRNLQEQYKSLRNTPGVVVEPQIEIMEAELNEAIEALAAGDVVRILASYETLKGYTA